MLHEAVWGQRSADRCRCRQSRHPPLLPPSLVISRFPPPPPVPSTTASVPPPIPTISAILRLLLPLTDTLPLSLDTLNKRRFVPESQDEDLHAGLLQLPQGTVVLITEGGVREGQLLERGTFADTLVSCTSTNALARRDECPCSPRHHGRPNPCLRFPLQPIHLPYGYQLHSTQRGP